MSKPKQELLLRLGQISRRRGLPPLPDLQKTIEAGLSCLRNEEAPARPRTSLGEPGGLVRLKPEGYFVIIPDLHGRMDFFNAVMNWSGFSGRPLAVDIAAGQAQVICVGDAFHSESRGRLRWQKAMKEWTGGYRLHRQMDGEMRENLGLLEMINIVKTSYPRQFHFLKGNHENIANEEGEGNHPFRKYAAEGAMVKLWVQTFLGMKFYETIYAWEKALPLLAEGPDFLISHAEPGRSITPSEVINAYDNPEIIHALTWTGNDQAEQGSVMRTLENFGKTDEESRIFGGHRAVSGYYALRQEGRYVQINTPGSWVIAAFSDIQSFRPDKNIICLRQG